MSEEPTRYRTGDLLPEYDHYVEPVHHFRCTVCGQWWQMECALADKNYWCPQCGKELAPAQYQPTTRPDPLTGALEL